MNDNELHQNSNLERSKDTPEGEIVPPRGSDKEIFPIFNDVQSVLGYLDQLAPKTKVRIIHKNYGLWREFLPLSETYKKKFSKWVEKKDFLISANREILQSKETESLQNSLIKWMETNNVPEEIKKILLEELK